MTDRETLIELVKRAITDWEHGDVSEKIADHLLANGVVVREKGEWTLGHVEPGYCTPGGNRPWVCPRCGWVMSWRLDKPKENFCPNCGADMRKGENG